MQKKISSLTHLSSQQIEPIDAKVTYKDQNFTITKESYGSKINQEQLIKAILQAFSEQKTEINVQDVHGMKNQKSYQQIKNFKNYVNWQNSTVMHLSLIRQQLVMSY